MRESRPGELAQADALAREQALDAARSFIVQAPAGSGKTTVLTQRYLKLLSTVEEPEQVLAITFTRKAAGEMRERVQRALDGVLAPASEADRVTQSLAAEVRLHAARRSWGLEESTARLRIQTIDAFNGYLANAMPITSRSGFGRGIADAPDDLYAAAARETMRHAETDPELRASFERILRRLDDGWMRLERLIAGMLSRRAEWLPNLPQLSGEALVPRIEAGLADIVADELANAVDTLPADFVELACEAARSAALHLAEGASADLAEWRSGTGAPLAQCADLSRWRALTQLSLTKEGRPRTRFTKAQGLPADDASAKALGLAFAERLQALDTRHIAALELMAALPDPEIPQDARAAMDALARLLLLAAAQLTRIFNEQRECDHTEVAGAARCALTQDSAPSALAERLGARISHILVDEFQDTSRDQYELLLTLTQDWSAGDGRTLFLVGDPMQSIYGFRNAEVGRFATVRAAGIGRVRLQPLDLRRNFRSAPGLVQWCNEVFARVFPAHDDMRRSRVRHLASVAARDDLAGEARLYRVEDGAHVAEADAAADLIANLLRARPEESIAVLAGARTHLRAIRAALAARQVQFIGINLQPLADVAAVRDLESLARALDSPLDRVAWLAVLRAPFVGLALADLTVVAEAARDTTIPAALSGDIPGLSPDAMERLVRVKPLLLAGWQQRELEPRAHLVERVWLAIGGPTACTQSNELTSARRFLLALDEEDRKRLRGRPLDFERLMNRLYAQDIARPGAVSLMTIHGAKGLEFDHVLVLGVGRRGRGDEPRLLNWLELPRPRGGDHLLMAPIRVRDDPAEGEEDSINPFIELLHRERNRAERSRLAYVALTRAKRSLHLYLHPRAQQMEGATSYGADAHSLLFSLWPALESQIAALPVIGADAAVTGEIEAPRTQLRQRLVRRFVAPATPPDVMTRADFAMPGREDEDIEFSWVRQTARRVGSVVHEALEGFGRRVPAATELPGMRARLQSRLEALGVDSAAAREGAQRAVAALRGTLEDPRGRWLFDPAHRDAHSELAISGLRAGQVVNAVIDRTFVDGAGIRWVVDFKSSPHEGGDLPGFLDQEALRYVAQLRRYAHLARELGPEPVRAGLYFPLLAAWREVDVN